MLVMDGHADFVKCVAVHRYAAGNPFDDGQGQTLVFSGSSDASIRVWNAETGKQLAKLDGHRRAVEAIVLDEAGMSFCVCICACVYGFIYNI